MSSRGRRVPSLSSLPCRTEDLTTSHHAEGLRGDLQIPLYPLRPIAWTVAGQIRRRGHQEMRADVGLPICERSQQIVLANRRRQTQLAYHSWPPSLAHHRRQGAFDLVARSVTFLISMHRSETRLSSSTPKSGSMPKRPTRTKRSIVLKPRSNSGRNTSLGPTRSSSLPKTTSNPSIPTSTASRTALVRSILAGGDGL